MTRRLSRFASLGVACGALSVAAAGWAQNVPSDRGPLQTPKPYNGTKTLGNIPQQYPNAGTRPGDPAPFFRSKILSNGSNGGYCGTTVIVLNSGVPCTVPSYYMPYDYSGARAGFNANFGGLSVGFQSLNQRIQTNTRYYESGDISPQRGYSRQAPQRNVRSRNADEESDNVPAARNQSRAAPKPGPDDEDSAYYLHRKPGPTSADPALAEAVADIQAAFRSGNVAGIEKHVRPTDQLVLQSKGRNRTPILGSAYLQMTRDALQELNTAKYSLDKFEPGSGGAWIVTGTHSMRGEDGAEKSFKVGFVLKKRTGAYWIAELIAEPLP